MNGFSKGIIASAPQPAEIVYKNFGCASSSRDLSGAEFEILGPSIGGIATLTSSNTMVLRFGRDYESQTLSEQKQFGDAAEKYIKAVSSEVGKITYEKFDRQTRQTAEGVLFFYQEVIKTALNSFFVSFSDERFRSFVPRFSISYLEISDNNKLIYSSGKENEEIGEVLSSQQINDLIGESFGLEQHVKPYFSFKFVPHEIIGAFCNQISTKISESSYLNSYSYYDNRGLNPKYLGELYNYVAKDQNPKSDTAKKLVKDLSKEKIIEMIIDFMFPQEIITKFNDGDTIKAGFFTIIKDGAYFKTPKMSYQDVFLEDEDFSFSNSKKVLLFTYQILTSSQNSIVLPYIYDKNRVGFQNIKDIYPISEEYTLFSSKAESFNYVYPEFDILNGSFDKYRIVLSICNSSGIEYFKFPLITMPYASWKDKNDKKAERSFIKDPEDMIDACRLFQLLPEEHYSFENGNMFSDSVAKRYEKPVDGYLQKATSKVLFLKTKTGNFFEENDIYVDRREDLSFITIPFGSFGSNIGDAIVKVEKNSLKSLIPEIYRERIILNVKMYLIDEFNQIFPILRKFEDETSKEIKISNLYRLFLKKPKIDSIDLSYFFAQSDAEKDSFSLKISGTDLEFSTKLTIFKGNAVAGTAEILPEHVSLDGKSIQMKVQKNIFVDYLGNTSKDQGFSGKVSFNVIIQDPLGYDSEVESNIVSKTINYEPGSLVKTEESTAINAGDIRVLSGGLNGG